MVDTGPGPKNGERERTRRPRFSPAANFFNLDWGDDLAEVVVCYAVLAGKADGGWTVADGEMLELRIWPLWFRRDARKAGQSGVCVGEQFLPGLFRTRASSSDTRDLRCRCKRYPGATLLADVSAAGGALPPGTWTLKGALTGTVVAVPGVGAFIADTEASRTLTSEGNVTGRTSSTHSLSSPSLCRGTAPDPQEHGSTSHQKS